MLKGFLHLPKTDHPPVVIGSHGLVSSKDSPKQIELARRCNTAGIAYFRFDHRGCGESQGKFEEVTSLSGRSMDLRQAIRILMLRRELGKRVALFGSSFGGTTVLNVAAELNATGAAGTTALLPAEISAIVTVAAPASSQYLDAEPERPPELDFLTPEFYQTHLQFDITGSLSNLHHVLVFHGDADSIVPVDNARMIFERVRSPKQLIIQENGDHPMSQATHQSDFQAKSIEWFTTYLL
jgi:alpha-beta hydrolase superfamily lysophospholipase